MKIPKEDRVGCLPGSQRSARTDGRLPTEEDRRTLESAVSVEIENIPVVKEIEQFLRVFAEVFEFRDQQEDTLKGKNIAFLKFPHVITVVPLVMRLNTIMWNLTTERLTALASSQEFQKIVETLSNTSFDRVGLVDPPPHRDHVKHLIEAYRRGRDMGIGEKPDIPVQEDCDSDV